MNKHWKQLVAACSTHGIEMYLQMEISEPIRGNRAPGSASTPRMHYHGYIYFDSPESIRHFLLYTAPVLANSASYDVDTIGDRDYWDQYIRKQSYLGLPDIATFKYMNGVKTHRKVRKRTKK